LEAKDNDSIQVRAGMTFQDKTKVFHIKAVFDSHVTAETLWGERQGMLIEFHDMNVVKELV